MHKNLASALVALRWIFCLPAGVAGGWLTWFAMAAINRISFFMSGFELDTPPAKFYIELTSGFALGAGFVYFCTKIAPKEKRKVVVGAAIVGLVALGFVLYPAVFAYKDIWPIANAVGAAIGVVGVAHSVYIGTAKTG